MDKNTSVTELVIQDIQQRAEIGLKKYGRKLHTFNGRSSLQDLYEELLDAAQYVKQRILEEEQTSVHYKIQALKEKANIWHDQAISSGDENYLDFITGYISSLTDLENDLHDH